LDGLELEPQSLVDLRGMNQRRADGVLADDTTRMVEVVGLDSPVSAHGSPSGGADSLGF
jgi:hypothetical protein